MKHNGTTSATGGAPRGGPNDIVVGLDDGPSAAAALRWAATQCRLTGQDLRVVHAWQLSTFEETVSSAGLADVASADARARATSWVHDTLGGGASLVRWSLVIEQGPPGQVLVSAADGGLLLVVGTHEHTGLRRAVHGSVSHYCLSHASVPVVAVPAPAQAPSEGAGTSGMLAAAGPLA